MSFWLSAGTCPKQSSSYHVVLIVDLNPDSTFSFSLSTIIFLSSRFTLVLVDDGSLLINAVWLILSTFLRRMDKSRLVAMVRRTHSPKALPDDTYPVVTQTFNSADHSSL